MEKTLYIVLGLLAIASVSAGEAAGEIEEAKATGPEEKYPAPESSPKDGTVLHSLEALDETSPSTASRNLRRRGTAGRAPKRQGPRDHQLQFLCRRYARGDRRLTRKKTVAQKRQDQQLEFLCRRYAGGQN